MQQVWIYTDMSKKSKDRLQYPTLKVTARDHTILSFDFCYISVVHGHGFTTVQYIPHFYNLRRPKKLGRSGIDIIPPLAAVTKLRFEAIGKRALEQKGE